MEEELKQLQTQIMNDITHTETIISAVESVVEYVDFGSRFINELHLTSSTLNDLIQRTSKSLEPSHIKSFWLATKQVKMMATDILELCKKNMYSA